MMVAILILMFVLTPGRTQDQGAVRWEVNESRLQVGEPAQIRLVFTNTPAPDIPEPPPVEGMTLTRLGDAPTTTQFTRSVNGRRSREVTYAFTFRVVGTRAGQVTLPAMTFEAGRKSYTTQPFTFEFIEPPPTAENPGDELLFIRIDVNRTRLYVTQRFTATLRIGIRRLQRQGATVDDRGTLIDYLRRQGKFDLGDFADQKFEVQMRSLADSTGIRHDYYVLLMQKEFRAEQPGTLSLRSVSAFLEYPVQWEIRRSFFDLELNPLLTKRVSARSEAVELTVLAPPEEGRPADFSGAIGTYTMEVSAKPTEVERDQPITLSIMIRGEPLEGVIGPNLSSHPELAGRFDFRQEDMVGEWVDDAKVIRQVVFPRAEGPQTIPPLRWSYFDPNREAYVTLESQPVEINVLPSTSVMASLSKAGSDASLPDSTLTVVSSGLSANVTNLNLLLADHDWRFGAVGASLFSGPPLLMAAVAVFQAQRRRRKGNKALVRRRSARYRAEKTLRRARSLHQPAHRLEAAAEAFRGFLADYFNLPPGAVTAEDARRELTARGASSDLVDAVVAFLLECDAVRFSGAAPAETGEESMTRVREWMSKIEELKP